MDSASSILLKLCCALFCLLLVSCGGGGGSALPSAGSGGSSGGGSAVGESPSDFYIAVSNQSELGAHVRTVGSFSTRCTIPSTTTAITDLQCIVDVPEGNLNLFGIKFAYNIPAGMCRHLRRSTYWFYNQEIGTGPTSLYLEKTVNASGVVTGYRCGENGGPLGPCNNLVEANVNTATDSAKCVYDRRDAEQKNCCLGSYRITLETINSSTATSSISTNDLEWGGDIRECLGGPGRTNWEVYTRSGYPTRIIEFAGNGVSANYEVDAPIQSTIDVWNISAANFYTPALHTHDGFVSATTSTLPYFVEPIDDRNGTPISVSGNVPYTWECLNESYEIKHRIRVFVRDWDLYSDFLTYISSAGATTVPDRPGDQEGVDCDGISPDPCNDKWDLDDYINELLGGPYPTTTPSFRSVLFPSQIYQ